MKVVVFGHPSFMASQSMPRFADMLLRACRAHGLRTEFWSPKAVAHRLATGTRLEKWAGYVDQYILFPMLVRLRVLFRRNTLYVFSDQALGPWVPIVAGRPHVIHVHDFLALKSALGMIEENPTSATGRLYQRFIRRGFQHGRNFISVSRRTERELREIGEVNPARSHVVYNGLNHPYRRQPPEQALCALATVGLHGLEQGFAMHVGGTQWYKNKPGVLHIYTAYAQACQARQQTPLPLLMIGPPLDAETQRLVAALPAPAKVLLAEKVSNDVLEAAYSSATALLFPSLAEGFGWPIIEAQACGCPVITTDDAPMNEIGGPDTHYVPRPDARESMQAWGRHGAMAFDAIVALSQDEREAQRQRMMAHAARFSEGKALAQYLSLYEQIYKGLKPC